MVEGVPNSIWTLRLEGVRHSIAEELWHIVYWQDLFLRWAQREPLPYPERAALGWRMLDTITNRSGTNWSLDLKMDWWALAESQDWRACRNSTPRSPSLDRIQGH